MTPSPVDRLPKVGETWRIPETKEHGPIDATITDVQRGKRVAYRSGAYCGSMRWFVFEASAYFLREADRTVR